MNADHSASIRTELGTAIGKRGEVSNQSRLPTVDAGGTGVP